MRLPALGCDRRPTNALIATQIRKSLSNFTSFKCILSGNWCDLGFMGNVPLAFKLGVNNRRERISRKTRPGPLRTSLSSRGKYGRFLSIKKV
jgi:hypothetical protein